MTRAAVSRRDRPVGHETGRSPGLRLGSPASACLGDQSAGHSCAGFILGVVLTIAIQVLAVVAGLRSFNSYVDRSVAEEEANRLHCDPPRDAQEAQDCYNSSETQIGIRRQQRLENEQYEGR